MSNNGFWLGALAPINIFLQEGKSVGVPLSKLSFWKGTSVLLRIFGLCLVHQYLYCTVEYGNGHPVKPQLNYKP